MSVYAALLWFDFALTFTTEVQRIWRRKFSGATVVYLFMRYSALIERVLFVLEVLVWKSSDKVCSFIDALAWSKCRCPSTVVLRHHTYG